MQVTWTKGFELNSAKLETLKANGVYIVYQAGNPPSTIFVGKGDIAQRLRDHKTEQRFEPHRRAGNLLVTYASVPAQSQEGVEKHLARLLAPKIDERRSESVQTIEVNLPFAA